MTGAKPLHVEIVWNSDLQFGASSGHSALVIDGHSSAGASPVQLLGMALLGCMSADVVDILRKGRHPLIKFHASLNAERAPDPPRRILKVQLRFAIHGDVPAAAVERAIALSREKYCAVWHSLREDIELTTAIDILATP
jgi:putative redox protein